MEGKKKKNVGRPRGKRREIKQVLEGQIKR